MASKLLKLPTGAFGVIALIVAGLSAASCAAPTRWVNPTVPNDQWDGDKALCRQTATLETERELAREQTYRGGAGPSRAGSFENEMARFDALRRRNQLFGDCMSAKGYVKATAKGSE